MITNRFALSVESLFRNFARTWFREKERKEKRERMRKRVGNDGHVYNGSSMFVLSHLWCSHPVRVRFTTLGPSARTAKTSVIRATTVYLVSCPPARVVKSQFTGHTRAHVSFVIPIIDSAISGYIFTFLSFVIKWYSFRMLDYRQYFRKRKRTIGGLLILWSFWSIRGSCFNKK